MSTSPPRKVLLVGWDAADWKVIHPLLDAGKMPHLARFLERGVMGNIATLQPALSPTLWTSITVGWWPSNPAEPLSKGVMVSNDYQHAHGSSTFEPEKWPLKPETIHPERLVRHLKDLRFHPAELTEVACA